MQKMKKALALLLALALTAGLGVTAFAATTHPSSSDTATATVYNVESGLEVTAYQIVYATYADTGEGLTGFEVADGCTIADIEDPTSTEIIAIAAAINSGTLSLTSVEMEEQSDGSYQADLTAGTWLVLVRTSGADSLVIYNPMIVSINYTDANDASSITVGSVDSEGNFESNAEGAVYAKQTTSYIDKSVSESGEDGTYGNEADVDVGDTVYFRIETTIPDYSTEYSSALFDITDEWTDGLEVNLTTSGSGLTVTVGGTVYKATTSTYQFTYSQTGNTFIVSFYTSFIFAHLGEDVVIEYSATVTDEAVMASEYNPNTVTLEYSNNPTTNEDCAVITDEVYVYTYELTVEIVKVGEEGDAEASAQTVTVTNPLACAEFTVYTDSLLTEIYTNDIFDGTYTTDDDGFIKIQGLDAGTYYITETDAPTGYTINDTVYTVVITPTYDDAGLLTAYTIAVTDSETGTTNSTVREYIYDTDYNTEELVQTLAYISIEPTVVEDIHLAVLPSTGANTAAAMMIIGILGVIAIVLFASRRRKTA